MKQRALLLGSVLALAGLASADAGPRDDVLEALGHCAAVADNTARLACYDTLSPQLKTALSTPPATMDRPLTADEQKSWFGFDVGGLFSPGSTPATQVTAQQFGGDRLPQTDAPTPQAGQQQPIDSISASITDYSFSPVAKKFVVFLDNGQIWKQIEGDNEVARFASNPKDNTVSISRGIFGSYNLQINGGSKIFKVTRVK